MMPLVPKVCLRYLRHYANSEIVVITENNYKDYIDIPDFVVEKLLHSYSITNFSDILRSALLSKYGGLWVDATVLMTSHFNMGNGELFTNHQPNNGGCFTYISHLRWSSYLIGGRPNLLFGMMWGAFMDYARKYDEFITYFLIDYIIEFLYRHNKEIAQLIDSVPNNNESILTLNSLLCDKYDKKVYDKLLKDNNYHKLSWKRILVPTNSSDDLTFWGFIVKQAIRY